MVSFSTAHATIYDEEYKRVLLDSEGCVVCEVFFGEVCDAWYDVGWVLECVLCKQVIRVEFMDLSGLGLKAIEVERGSPVKGWMPVENGDSDACRVVTFRFSNDSDDVDILRRGDVSNPRGVSWASVRVVKVQAQIE